MQIKLPRLFSIILLLTFACSAQVIYSRADSPLEDLYKTKTATRIFERPRIALVLSGGGARGIAHVGVLKRFEELNVPIDLIVGTSVGSVVGGFYCAGYNAPRLEKLVREINWNDLFRDDTERRDLFLGQKVETDRYLLNVRFDGLKYFLPTSLTPGQKILTILSERLLDANFRAAQNFDRLDVPFRAVATDLISGDRIVIDKGDLAEAINASIAVPLLFSPVAWDGGRRLVDGGLRSNLPVDVARDLNYDIVVAVDIASPLRKEDELRAPWEIADQVTTIMMNPMRQSQLDKADYVIQPNLEGVGSSDFSKIDEMIAEGENAADSVAKMILVRLNNHAKMSGKGGTLISRVNITPDDSCINAMERNGLQAEDAKRVTLAAIKNDVDFLFNRGRFNKVEAEFHITGPDTALEYRVAENKPLKLVHFAGNSMIADSVLRRLITHPMNSIMNSTQLYNNLQSVRQLYFKQGYALMDFNRVTFDPEKGELNVEIDEGRIGNIQIKGNENTNPYVILREFPIKINDVFNSVNVRKGIQNIYTTQLFDKVNVGLEEIRNRHELVIRVQEKRFTVLRLGGKIDNERNARGYFELADENFMGRGNTLSLRSQLGGEIRTASLNYRVDRIFSSYLTFSLHGYYDWRINPFFQESRRRGTYTEERKGVRLVFGQQLKKLGQLTAELRAEHVNDKNRSGTFTSEKSSEIRTLTLRSVTDKRDRIGFTRNGTYNIWFWESGNERILEGEEKYTKAMVSLEAYYTYWQHHTFHVRVMGGLADRTLPFSEYFRLGGVNSFMGLHEDEFFGRQIFNLNLEYRLHIPWPMITDTYFALRYDIGGIWENPDLVLKSQDFFYGLGGWLGFDTLFGPLEIGYGRMTLGRDAFYVTLGYDF